MKELNRVQNPYQEDKVIEACSILGAMDPAGKSFSGEGVIRAITNMHARGNGLGGGFAVYGLYPDFKDYYAFHIMFLSRDAKEKTDRILASAFNIIYDEELQTKPANVTDPPLGW